MAFAPFRASRQRLPFSSRPVVLPAHHQAPPAMGGAALKHERTRVKEKEPAESSRQALVCHAVWWVG